MKKGRVNVRMTHEERQVIRDRRANGESLADIARDTGIKYSTVQSVCSPSREYKYPIMRACIACSTLFAASNSRNVFCSERCRKISNGEIRNVKSCLICGKIVPDGNKKYCSPECCKEADKRFRYANSIKPENDPEMVLHEKKIKGDIKKCISEASKLGISYGEYMAQKYWANK